MGWICLNIERFDVHCVGAHFINIWDPSFRKIQNDIKFPLSWLFIHKSLRKDPHIGKKNCPLRWADILGFHDPSFPDSKPFLFLVCMRHPDYLRDKPFHPTIQKTIEHQEQHEQTVLTGLIFLKCVGWETGIVSVI